MWCGVGKGNKPDSTFWTTVDVKRAHYEFVCNLENHYFDGMYQEVVVI